MITYKFDKNMMFGLIELSLYFDTRNDAEGSWDEIKEQLEAQFLYYQ
jgi:translation elongation factor EF-1beta